MNSIDGKKMPKRHADATPKIGSVLFDEQSLIGERERVSNAVVAWAKSHDLWRDSGFRIPFVRKSAPPVAGEVLSLCVDGPLYGMFWHGLGDETDRLQEQFYQLVDRLGYESEFEEHTTLTLTPKDDVLMAQFLRLYRWQWIQDLSARRLFDVHAEVFGHFATHPEDLKRLSWRQFEEFLESIFKNQGFRTELGPGGSDGGVDIRLYQSETIPEIVTLVQAKRYGRKPIELDAVAALFGLTVEKGAASGILATTSRFLPVAQRFALSVEQQVSLPSLQLADSERVREWCADISRQLTEYFSTGSLADVPPIIASRPMTDLTGSIVVARYGYNTSSNAFAVVEADYPHEVILRPIGERIVQGDWQRGADVPDPESNVHWTKDARIVAFKRTASPPLTRLTFWGDQKLFVPWEGRPKPFDRMD